MEKIEVYGRLEFWDYVIVVGYLALSMIIGLMYAVRGTKNIKAYFVGESAMPWWLTGVSIVATCFAADTPLWIGDMIYKRGIEGIWMHCAPAIGVAFFCLIIAPLWRRSGILTDMEFLELRYTGKAAAVIRLINSVYYSLFFNIIMIAVSTLSVTTIMQATTGMDKLTCVLITMSGALIYCIVSGIWGVCATDFMQFFVAFIGSAILAVFAVIAAGGTEAMLSKIHHMNEWQGNHLNIFPEHGSGLGLPAMTVIFLFMLRWVRQAGIGDLIAQRLFATKTVKQAVFSAMVFSVVYYAIVPLPWIITIVASKVVMPELVKGQEAYPRMAMAILPVGLKGLLVASILAAFMSTYSSLLSWGSSYFINDFYQRFLVKNAPVKHYVRVGQMIMIPMAITGGFIALYADSILNLIMWSLLATVGYSTLSVARWLWWRVNIWSEISAIGGGFLFMGCVPLFFSKWVQADQMEAYFGHRTIFVALATMVLWLVVTLLTPAVDNKTLESFYVKVRPPGFWKPVRERLGMKKELSTGQILYGWGIMLVATFCPLVGLIKFFFGERLLGVILTAVGIAGLYLAIQMAGKLYDKDKADTATKAET